LAMSKVRQVGYDEEIEDEKEMIYRGKKYDY
jgi:hypothetical protein